MSCAPPSGRRSITSRGGTTPCTSRRTDMRQPSSRWVTELNGVVGRSPRAAGVGLRRPTLLGRRAECEVLDRLVADVVSGSSRVLVVRGEAGVGKSALLRYMSERTADWRVTTAVGVESEMGLAYSGLHQVCAPLLEHLEKLPMPQHDALATVLGLRCGPA